MKTKALIWFGLILQFCSILFILCQLVEPSYSIKIGLQHLQAACPSEAAAGLKTADGNRVIRTAGDFFSMADNWYKFIIAGALFFIAVNILVFILLLLSLRKKRVFPIQTT